MIEPLEPRRLLSADHPHPSPHPNPLPEYRHELHERAVYVPPPRDSFLPPPGPAPAP